jgi:chaperonin GroES
MLSRVRKSDRGNLLPLRTTVVAAAPSSQLGVAFMDVRPLHDRIIVRRLAEGEQKSGAIIIPDTAKEKPQRGEVIAAGNGKVKDDGTRIALDVKPGDQILFGKIYEPGSETRWRGVPHHARRRGAGRDRRRQNDATHVTSRRGAPRRRAAAGDS